MKHYFDAVKTTYAVMLLAWARGLEQLQTQPPHVVLIAFALQLTLLPTLGLILLAVPVACLFPSFRKKARRWALALAVLVPTYATLDATSTFFKRIGRACWNILCTIGRFFATIWEKIWAGIKWVGRTIARPFRR